MTILVRGILISSPIVFADDERDEDDRDEDDDNDREEKITVKTGL